MEHGGGLPVGREHRRSGVEGDGGIVVAHHGCLAALADNVSACAGLWAVADDVAEAEERVGAASVRLGENGREGVGVGVDIGENGEAHGLEAGRMRAEADAFPKSRSRFETRTDTLAG